MAKEMDILIDTNIFIYREDDEIVPEPLRKMERSLKKAGHTITVHPLSVKEIRQDPKKERREQAESRAETYVQLSYPPSPSRRSSDFRETVEKASDFNEQVDNMLLFAVYDDAVDFLVTEDGEMHRKALELGIQDRIFTMEEGKDYFSKDHPPIRGPVAIRRTTFGELNLDDPIFDSLKEEYDGFVSWAQSKSDRTAWVNHTTDGQLGAILILKPKEVEDIGNDPLLGRDSRLKISTLKVGRPRWGSKVGELLISIAIREAINHELDQVYLTHYADEEDYLVDLIESYGFEHASNRADGEEIFLKRLTPSVDADSNPIETANQYYPSFYDGPDVKKFIVPVRPEYHNKLFTSYQKRQAPLNEFHGEFNSEGNAIKKAYLSNSKTRKINPGDLLLFYRSEDQQEVTSLGVCEQVEYGLTDPNVISRTVGKRSVFSERDIEEIAASPTTVLLFSWHFDLRTPVSYKQLIENDVLSGPPQVMQVLDEQGYKFIRQEGGIDERFALD